MASRRDATGSIVGLLVFLAGVGLLGLTFKLAYDLFQVPQAQALHLSKNQPFDARETGGGLLSVVIQLGVLVVMAFVGSMLANKGIGLYSGSLHPMDAREKGTTKREEGAA